MSIRDVMSTIGEIQKRIERLERMQGVKISGGGSAAPASATYVTVDDEATNLANSRQLAGGVDIDLADAGAGGALTIHRSGNTVLRYDNADTLLAEYAKTGAGVVAALAAAATGDVVELVPGTYTTDLTIPDGVTLRGCGWKSVVAGSVTIGNGAYLDNVYVLLSGNSANNVYALVCEYGDTAYVRNTKAFSDNAGAGGAYALKSIGTTYLYDCDLYGESGDIYGN